MVQVNKAIARTRWYRDSFLRISLHIILYAVTDNNLHVWVYVDISSWTLVTHCAGLVACDWLSTPVTLTLASKCLAGDWSHCRYRVAHSCRWLAVCKGSWTHQMRGAIVTANLLF